VQIDDDRIGIEFTLPLVLGIGRLGSNRPARRKPQGFQHRFGTGPVFGRHKNIGIAALALCRRVIHRMSQQCPLQH
jgi:hypothetical protein